MKTTSPTIHDNVEGDYPDYLRDESRRTGSAGSISFPRSEEDIREILASLHARKVPVTVQGARTGIAAGAVPDGGHIMNLSRMARITGLRHAPEANAFFVRAEPGVILAELRKALFEKAFDAAGWAADSLEALDPFRRAPPFFFTPDPTETSATIGGMAACNASGARSYRYGPTRQYVESARIVLVDGSVLRLRRGEHRANGRHFSAITDGGRRLEGDIPAYRMPHVKNAAGYFAADDMDLLDLFIGSEGTLGIFSEIELRLVPSPAAKWGVTAFFPAEENAIRFVRAVRGEEESAMPVQPCAIEFFDCRALNLLRSQKQANSAFAHIPDMPPAFHTAVYVEYHGASDDEVGAWVGAMSEAMIECGGSEDATWIATNDREMEPLQNFRHAVPEAVNLTIDERRKQEPRLTKLGTDMAVPDECLERVIALYHRKLDGAGLDYVMFGHIGNNHIHVNILPRELAEYEAGKRIYIEWAQEVIRMGGTVSAEHGVGKLKVELLRAMYGDAGIGQMRAVKRVFDPEFLLNKGNLFGRE